ncbi:thioredoxin-like protein [Tricladium varicosporioides]|nr:thioredoxin-like protein [Hymenoscyphus varicosporioides]
MPSARRIKVFGLLVFLFVITVLFYTASLRQVQPQDSRTVGDFYAKTVNALDKKPGEAGTGKAVKNEEDEEVARAMSERLAEAAKLAKDKANKKAPKPDAPSSVVGVGSAADGANKERGVAGRKKFTSGESQEPVKENERVETEEEHKVEVELNSILKKSPIIIFSKSYCPYSRKAKGILLEKYLIDPAPFVVELDQHPLGQQLQASLADLTGRRTVPNILINGVSIGGGDDIAEMDVKRTLTGKINELGGKKMVEVKVRPIENGEGEHGLR